MACYIPSTTKSMISDTNDTGQIRWIQVVLHFVEDTTQYIHAVKK